MKEETRSVRRQFDRVNQALEESDPGSEEYNDLLIQWNRLYDCLLANEKTVAELEFKESELMMKQEEAKKPFYKRPEIIIQLISVGASIFEIGQILYREETGVITSKAMNLLHKLRIK